VRFDDLTDRRVVIWGAGREGRAARAELAERGVTATIAVTGPGEPPAGVLGGDAAWEALTGAEAIVKSPGIPHTSPEYVELVGRGAAMTSLTDLWLNENRDRVIAVTGTKGKSTTSALVHHILRATGHTAELAGNIGIPVGPRIGDDIDCAVTEISSYQAAELSASPRVAVLTSLYPEHLPWHGGYDRYVADKLNLLAHAPETIVLPSHAGELAERAREVAGDARILTPADLGIRVTSDELVWDGAGAVALADIALVGSHNLANAALALAAVDVYVAALDRNAALAAVARFSPLEHRLEVVPSGDGRTWIDDGLATAPQAVVAALAALVAPRIALVMGGAERDLPFDVLIDALASRDDVTVVCTGPAGSRFARDAAGRVPRIRAASGFRDALEIARSVTAAGDTILLSPGAPSFDEFTDYEARSAAFRAAASDSTPHQQPRKR
jgi:UDP-N-acetylmuramoylalanine--D-glutamate ligase